MIRIQYRLSWLSFGVWLWVMVPICVMNYMIIPDAVSKGKWMLVGFPLFFFLIGYFVLAMLPFRSQRQRLAEGIKAAVLL